MSVKLRRKNKKLVPIDAEGNQIDMVDKELMYFSHVASKRTHMIGLHAGVGDITIKEALQAAYIQGMQDIILSGYTL